MSIHCPKCRSDNKNTASYCQDCGTQLHSDEKIQDSHTKTMETPIEAFAQGTLFAGRYEIFEVLGMGGMGYVYRVLDNKVNEEIALKLIRPEIAADQKTIERFRNELKIARKIRHANVCGMYDLGDAEGRHFITMELVSGGNLEKLIRQAAPLSTARTIAIAKQISEGLAEAHRLGVVHRDLKPSNIMIDDEGNARIMDFGIARSLRGSGLTGEGLMIGTPTYMSPEQAEAGDVDQCSDIYSLGVILHEMLTGVLHPAEYSPFNIAERHKSYITKTEEKGASLVAHGFSQLILRCLEREKHKRYQNGGEILSALKKMEKDPFVSDGARSSTMFPSIAVLPFVDLSPKKDHEYFCDGLAEELINSLSRIDKLQVASRTSSFLFRGVADDIKEIGAKLKVRTVLEGSVRKAGNRLRISAQLVNVEDGYDLWAEKFDRDMEDIFAIQDEISLAIVDKLKVKLVKEEKEKLVRRYTDDPEAYNLYLKGRYFWNRRYEGGLQKGMEFFDLTIKKDPSFAPAYAGIADSFSTLGLFGWLPPEASFPKAKAAAQRALQIDNTLPEAHTSLGWIYTVYDWNWTEAEKYFKQALEINPNYDFGHVWYAIYLCWMGRMEEGVAQINKALEIDPLALVANNNLGHVLYYRREYDKAVKQCLKTTEMDPNYLLTHWFLGGAYSALGKYKEMTESFKKAVTYSDNSPFFLGFLGWGLGFSGQKEEAQKVLEKLEVMSTKRHVSSYSRAIVYMGLGEMDNTFEYLEKAFEEREPTLPSIKVAPFMDSIRSDARFKALLKKMQLP
ncbi:protein kinase [Acidobacteriota bacterium]